MSRWLLATLGFLCSCSVGWAVGKESILGPVLFSLLYLKDPWGIGIWFWAAIALLVLSIGGLGGGIGYLAGRFLPGALAAAAAVAMLCGTLYVSLRPSDTERRDEMRRRIEKEGFHKIQGVEQRAREDRSGWDFRVRTAGNHPGPYSIRLVCPGLFYKEEVVPLSTGSAASDFFVPSADILEYYRQEVAQYAKDPQRKPPSRDHEMQVSLHPVLPLGNPYVPVLGTGFAEDHVDVRFTLWP